MHVFVIRKKERRGCPAAQTSLRSLRKLDCVAGHDVRAKAVAAKARVTSGLTLTDE
jgi:hypothetical protein